MEVDCVIRALSLQPMKLCCDQSFDQVLHALATLMLVGISHHPILPLPPQILHVDETSAEWLETTTTPRPDKRQQELAHEIHAIPIPIPIPINRILSSNCPAPSLAFVHRLSWKEKRKKRKRKKEKKGKKEKEKRKKSEKKLQKGQKGYGDTIGSNYRRRCSTRNTLWNGLRLLPPTSFPPNLAGRLEDFKRIPPL